MSEAWQPFSTPDGLVHAFVPLWDPEIASLCGMKERPVGSRPSQSRAVTCPSCLGEAASMMRRLRGDTAINAHRSQLLADLPNAIASAKAYQRDSRSGVVSLFEGDPVDDQLGYQPALGVVSMTTQERLSMERGALGVCLSGHPMQRWQYLLPALTTHTVAQLSAEIERYRERRDMGGHARHDES